MWLFSKNTEDIFNEVITCIIILLSFMQFSGYHICCQHLVDTKWCIMYLVLYAVLKLHVKGTLSCSSKVKNKSKHKTADHFQHCFRFMIYFIAWNHNFYSLLINLLTLLYFIDLKISPECLVNTKARILWI